MTALFSTSILHDATSKYPSITTPATVDPHVHLRLPDEDGDGRMELAVAHCATIHDIVYGIANIKGLTTTPALRRYKKKARAAIPTGSYLAIHIARLLTDQSDLGDFGAGWVFEDGERAADALKIFLPGVSNDEGMSLRDWRNVRPILAWASDNQVPVFIHLELGKDRRGRDIRILDREYRGLIGFLKPLRREYPDLIVHVLHVADVRLIDYIADEWQRGRRIYGGLCPQYWLRTFTDLFRNACMHAHELCWPIYGEEEDANAVGAAMLSGLPCFRYETDFAMHRDDHSQPSGVKITRDGEICGGLGILPEVAMSLTINRFVEAGKPELIAPFTSGFARAQLGLPPANTQVTYQWEKWTVPREICRTRADGTTVRVVPFLAGETMHWKRVI